MGSKYMIRTNHFLMNVIVKAAHCIRKDVLVPSFIGTAVWGAGFSDPSLKKLAMDALYRSEDFEYSYKHELLIHENVFDAIYPLCTGDDKRLLMTCLSKGFTLREFRSEVVLNVEPCMRVGALTSLLKAVPWIPKDNLVLVKEEGASPLEDDCSTLNDCGIANGVSLLACMDGSFPVTIRDLDPSPIEEFVIPISSCFETVGSLKKKIQQKKGKNLVDLCLVHQNRTFSKKDDIPLVAHGIVRRYGNTLDKSDDIKMFTMRNFNLST